MMDKWKWKTRHRRAMLCKNHCCQHHPSDSSHEDTKTLLDGFGQSSCWIDIGHYVLGIDSAMVAPNISVVFGLLGGTTSSVIGFILPGMVGIKVLDADATMETQIAHLDWSRDWNCDHGRDCLQYICPTNSSDGTSINPCNGPTPTTN